MDKKTITFDMIIRYGTVQDFLEELKKAKKSIRDIANEIDEQGISLLEYSLSYRKFDISNLLIDNGAKINVYSKQGLNEFSYLAPNLRFDGAIEIGEKLLKLGVELENESTNLPMLDIFRNLLGVTDERKLSFVKNCIKKIPNTNDKKKSGISVYDFIKKFDPIFLEKNSTLFN